MSERARAWLLSALLVAAAACVGLAVTMERAPSDSLDSACVFWLAVPLAGALFVASLVTLATAPRTPPRGAEGEPLVCPCCAEPTGATDGRCRACGERR